MIDVTVLFLEGGHASTATGPVDVFREAGVLWNVLQDEPPSPRFRVRTASIGGRPVRTPAGYALEPDAALEDVASTDLLFVPSAGLGLDGILARSAPVIDLVRRLYGRGTRIASVCSGVSILAASGLLDGRAATTHWGLADEFRTRFPRVDWRPGEIVTESDEIYCGGGVYAALDLALYLVEKLCDRLVAVQCAKSLLIEMPRACQTGFALLPLGARHDDEAIRRGEAWILGHCREEIRFEALARELGMSPRNFIRRFKSATGLSPVEYLQRLRVRAAQRLLEEERATVHEVGRKVGYEDAPFFRRVFKRHAGVSPGAYRARFAAEAEPAPGGFAAAGDRAALTSPASSAPRARARTRPRTRGPRRGSPRA